MSNLTLGGALEQPCEKYHNVGYITLGGALEALEQPWKIQFVIWDTLARAGLRRRRRPGVRRAEGAPSNPGNVAKDTPLGLDSAARLCETRTIGTTERKDVR